MTWKAHLLQSLNNLLCAAVPARAAPNNRLQTRPQIRSTKSETPKHRLAAKTNSVQGDLKSTPPHAEPRWRRAPDAVAVTAWSVNCVSQLPTVFR